MVLEVTSAPARLGDSGARWFVARFGGLEQSCSVFFDDSLALWNKAGFDAGPGKSLAVEDGSSLQEFVGGIEVTASWRL